MAKVILITSRNIVVDKLTAIDLNGVKTIGTGGLAGLNKQGYLAPFLTDLFPCLLNFDDAVKQELMEFAKQNANESSKLKDKIEEKIKIKNKGGGKFVLGIFQKNFIKQDDYDLSVYFANEFPPLSGASNEHKFTYLNAILAEICAIKKINPIDVEWEIFSHDRDWGSADFSSHVLKDKGCGYAGIGSIKKDDYPILFEIVSAQSTRICLFTHDPLCDMIYLYVQRLLNGNEFIEYDSFSDKTQSNYELFRGICSAAEGSDRDSKIEEFIKNVDPEFGIFPSE